MASASLPLLHMNSSASKLLAAEFAKLKKKPIEGFQVDLNDEWNVFFWKVVIYGPPDTLYNGGYFNGDLIFPENYPYKPPSFQFKSLMWHPNIYPSGHVCISILESADLEPEDSDPSVLWNPTQNVRTVLLSIISLLNEPNIQSPANLDAAKMYREWVDKENTKYRDEVRATVEVSIKKARKEGIENIPSTVEEYLDTGNASRSASEDEEEEAIGFADMCAEDYDPSEVLYESESSSD